MSVIEHCPHCSTVCTACGGPRDLALSTMCYRCVRTGKMPGPRVSCCDNLRGAVEALEEIVGLGTDFVTGRGQKPSGERAVSIAFDALAAPGRR